jgi:hypothetical protein
MELATLQHEARNLGTKPLGLRPAVKEFALPTWVTETLLIVLPVNIYPWSDLTGQSPDRHQLIVNAGD